MNDKLKGTTKTEAIPLKPGDLGVYNSKKNNITTSKVDVQLYIAWIEGNMIFRNAGVNEISKSLKRQYNVEVFNGTTRLDNIQFNASFNTNSEDIENFLYYFSCLLYTSPSPRDLSTSRMPSSA